MFDERIKYELLNLYPNGIVTRLSMINPTLDNKIGKICKDRNMNKKEYLRSLGLQWVRTRTSKLSYEKNLEILLNELNDTFPEKIIINFNNSKDSIHRKLYFDTHNFCNKFGYSIPEFLKKYDFIQERSYSFNTDRQSERVPINNKNKNKQQHYDILKPYIIGDGGIYISSFDPVYTKYRILAYKYNQNLTEYLKKEFGLDRYTHIKDIPSHLTPRIEKMTYTEEKEEVLKEKINEYYLVDEELKTIYITTNSSFYWVLFKYCDSLDKDIDEVVNNWGFFRLKKTDLDKVEEESLNKEDIENLLADMQILINKEEVEISRQKRSQRLVKTLKEMYDYQCQICGELLIIPEIQMQNGNKYVEVHHIVPLHQQDSLNDESESILDDYKNAIVVCAHHHKVLHYENGGYLDIKKIHGELYFVNNNGNRLIIRSNYHLSENDYLVSKLINQIKLM